MLSLVHLIYMAGDKCMRQNACSQITHSPTFGRALLGEVSHP